MMFAVRRTSRWFDDETPPCEGAERTPALYVHVRSVATPEEFDASFAHREGPWLSKGQDHRIIRRNGQPMIARDEPAATWTIEIQDLPALLAFTARHGDVIVGESRYRDLPSLEVYDDYRE